MTKKHGAYNVDLLFFVIFFDFVMVVDGLMIPAHKTDQRVIVCIGAKIFGYLTHPIQGTAK